MSTFLDEESQKTSTVCLVKENGKKIIVNEDSLKVGDVKEDKFQIEHKVVANQPEEDNTWTPLHEAVKQGRYVMLELLIKNGADLDCALAGPKDRGFTPLHLAAKENRLKCAKLLLDHGASVSSRIEGVCDPIHVAVFNNNVKMTCLLLDHGAGINVRLDNKFFEKFESPMHRSLWLDHNLPLLHYSILRKFTRMTKLLITRGADVNLKTHLEKTTLMQAVEVTNYQLVNFLVKEKKVNVNDRDIFGQPVLHFLILNAKTRDSMYDKEEIESLALLKIDILRKLWSNRANLNARFPENEERSSIIHYMIKYGYSDGVFELLSYQNNLEDFKEIDLQSIYSAQISSQHITPDIESDSKFFAEIKNNYALIVNFIVQRAIRDQMMGLPVDENLILEKPIHDWYSVGIYQRIMEYYRNMMISDTDYLKEQTVGDTNVTVWHLLTCTMDKLVKLMSINVIRNFNILDVYDSIGDDMAAFVSIFKSRFRIAKKRKQLLEDCAEIIFDLFSPYLPYHCCENIVGNLNNQALIFLHPTLKTTDEEDQYITDEDDDDPVDL